MCVTYSGKISDSNREGKPRCDKGGRARGRRKEG
jgi:hypothetical protein